MSLEVLHQIKYLCRKISSVEWSGALFYTVEGSIKQPETLKLILKTILPLDMGVQAYTEYKLDDRFLDFIDEDFEERCTWKLGHIHSHNTMAVFFSGTDMAELNDNAPSHNFYLSLIVNNAMDFKAKVAFTAEATRDIRQVPYTALDENGESYIIEKVDFEINSEKLFVYDCIIDSPLIKEQPSEQFEAQVAKIMVPKPKSTSVTPSFPSPKQDFSKNNRTNYPLKKPAQVRKKEDFQDWGMFDNFNFVDEEEDLDELAELESFVINNFVKDLLTLDKKEVLETLEETLELLPDYNLSAFEISKIVINKYGQVFALHFPKANAQEFTEYTYEAIDVLEDCTIIYPELKATVKVITTMIEKFLRYEYSATK